MNKPSVDDALKEGMYGPKEIKPEERRQFLGTLRERIVVVLKNGQVTEQKVYPQIEQNIKEHPTAHLFLNGNIDYEQLSKYVKLANKYHIEHTIVTNKEHNTEIGLVLAMDHAIDKEEIYVEKIDAMSTQNEAVKKKSFFSKLFKW
ncbi:YueI family protein [Bacillus sp. EB600]|nr:YueI family protein [Bacillus sp. EB600]